MKIKAIVVALFVVFSTSSVLAQRVTTVRGVVSDELGGVIVGATISLIGASQPQSTVSDETGAYRFNNVAPGNYLITVAQPGFATFQQQAITVVEGQTRVVNVTMRVAALEGEVTVDPGGTINTDPTANKSALVLKGNDLNALSDDPNELAAELSALAGPSAGPSGAQVFVDGFTAGPVLPDKQSIREIVINQNPFSAPSRR